MIEDQQDFDKVFKTTLDKVPVNTSDSKEEINIVKIPGNRQSGFGAGFDIFVPKSSAVKLWLDLVHSNVHDKYLELITEEHSIIKEENALTLQLQTLERTEREKFSKMSAAVRDSHEKERAQAEKTKYWSVLGSVIGTCLGLLGATINNRMRMRELRQIVTDSTQVNSSAPSVAAITPAPAITMAAFESQQKQLEAMSANFLEILSNIDTRIGGLGKAIENKPKEEVKIEPKLKEV